MPIDIKKGRQLIRKIQYLMDSLDDKQALTGTVERDLMLDYVRSLYDLLLFEEQEAPAAKKSVRKNESKPEEVTPPPPKIDPTPPPPKKQIPKPAPAPEVQVAPATPASNANHEKLFTFKAAKELSEKLQEMPVDNLAKAFSINERLLTISKLFDGDDDAFKQVLKDLDNMSSFAEAKSYLSSQVVDKFGWMNKERFKTAKIFVKKVRRRYM